MREEPLDVPEPKEWLATDDEVEEYARHLHRERHPEWELHSAPCICLTVARRDLERRYRARDVTPVDAP